MQHRTLFFALSLGLAQLHCGDGDEPVCVPGAQIECACPGGAPGIQVCEPDGLALGACECGEGGGGAGPSTGGGGDGGAGANAGAGPGGGGNGGSGPCAPGAEEACYQGPANTQGVGICQAGTRLCDVTGSWGECMGQLLPLPEDCQTEADENCDGGAPACGAGFVKTLGATTTVHALAIDQDGNVFILGHFDGTVDFGGGNTLTDIGPYDTYLAKLDANGNHLWSHAFGDPIGNAFASDQGALAVDSTGAVYAAMGFIGDVNVFGDIIESEGEMDGLLVKVAADGTPVRANHFGSAAIEYVESITVDADDNLIFTMAHSAPIYFGGADVLNSGRALVKYDPDGSHIFSRTTLNLAGGFARVITDPVTNAILLGCQYDQTVDLGLGPLNPAVDGRTFFGFFDPLDGSAVSYGATGGTVTITNNDTLIAPNGDIVIAGYAGTPAVLDFGQPNPAADQAYVARLTPDLQPVFVRTFTATGQLASVTFVALGLDSVGDAKVFGTVNGASPASAQIGATTVTDASFSFDVDAQGTISNVDVIGPPSSVITIALERAPDGVMIAGGFFFGGTFEIGGQTLSGPVGTDQGFVVRMAPN